RLEPEAEMHSKKSGPFSEANLCPPSPLNRQHQISSQSPSGGGITALSAAEITSSPMVDCRSLQLRPSVDTSGAVFESKNKKYLFWSSWSHASSKPLVHIHDGVAPPVISGTGELLGIVEQALELGDIVHFASLVYLGPIEV